MAIIKHGKIYRLDIRISGHRVRRSHKTGERSLAYARAAEMEQKLRAGAAADEKGPSLRDFAKQYLEYAWAHKPASADREQQRLEKILAFLEGLGVTRLVEVTPFHIEQLRARLKEHGLGACRTT